MRARATGVPGVAAGFSHGGETVFAADGVLELGARRAGAGRHAVPDRVDLEAVHGDARCARCRRARRASCARCLSHTAGLPLRVGRAAAAGGGRGLWSYSNAGYWAGRRARRCVRRRSTRRCATHVLEPLGLWRDRATTSRRRLRAGMCRRARPGTAPCASTRTRRRGGRRAGSGRRSATCFASARTTSTARRRSCTSRARDALGARYALGWWVREPRTAGRARPRGLGRRLPVAAPARAGARSSRSRC